MTHTGLLACAPGAASHLVGEAYLGAWVFCSGRALSSAKHCLFQISERAFTKVPEACENGSGMNPRSKWLHHLGRKLRSR